MDPAPEQLAARLFDNGEALGRTIRIGRGRREQALSIVGVVAARHTRPSDPDIYRPLGRDARGGGQNLQMICQLQDSATLSALNAELAGLLEEGRRRGLFNDRVSVAYSAMTRHEFEFGTFRPQLNTLLMAVLLVLVAGAAASPASGNVAGW